MKAHDPQSNYKEIQILEKQNIMENEMNSKFSKVENDLIENQKLNIQMTRDLMKVHDAQSNYTIQAFNCVIQRLQGLR